MSDSLHPGQLHHVRAYERIETQLTTLNLRTFPIIIIITTWWILACADTNKLNILSIYDLPCPLGQDLYHAWYFKALSIEIEYHEKQVQKILILQQSEGMLLSHVNIISRKRIKKWIDLRPARDTNLTKLEVFYNQAALSGRCTEASLDKLWFCSQHMKSRGISYSMLCSSIALKVMLKLRVNIVDRSVCLRPGRLVWLSQTEMQRLWKSQICW